MQIKSIPPDAVAFLVQDAASRDAALARRLALLKLLLDERYLNRQQLMTRVTDRLGAGCFGTAWKDNFYRDMRVVKAALEASGGELVYSRRRTRSGYYLAGQPAVSGELSLILRQSTAELDREQIQVFRRLTSAERFRLGCSVTDTARDAVAYRLRQRSPGLSPAQASFQALQGRNTG